MARKFTQQTYDKLTHELSDRENVKRREIASRLREAKEFGDLSENAAYKDAREAEQRNETRIVYLKSILKDAQVIQNTNQITKARLGTTVKVKRLNDNQIVSYTLVDAEEASPGEGLISGTSPVGRALHGKVVGDEAEVETPRGRIKFQIIEIS